MKLLGDTWYLYLRLVRDTRRMPVFVIMSIVQPVLWMVLFGQLFRAVATMPGFGASSYVQFLAPGIAVMTALFGSAFTGIGMLRDMETGFLDRLLATPVSRGAIVGARLCLAASQVVMQAAIILGLALVLGARPHGGVSGLLLVFLATSFLGAAFTGLSSTVALVTRRQELVIALMNFIVLPTVYLSQLLISSGLMPDWMRVASRFNPVNWAVILSRSGFEGQGQEWGALGLLFAFVLACATLATRAFGRYRAST